MMGFLQLIPGQTGLIRTRLEKGPALRFRPTLMSAEPRGGGAQVVWCESLSKSYDGVRIQVEDASMVLRKGARVAVIGVNGTGKSTFLRILAGLESPDSGQVGRKKGLRIVFVSQDPISNDDLTPLETLYAADTPTNRAIREYELAMSSLDKGECTEEKLERVMAKMDALQAWDAEANARQILSRLGLDYKGILTKRVRDLSGGQQKRVALAAALVQSPDVIMLDEPTNHLDIDAIEWLERAVTAPELTVMLVTHDRYFLDRTCGEILELDRGKLYRHFGGYEKFLESKAQRLLEEERTVQVATNRLKKEAEWMRRQPKARGTKSKSRIEQFYSLKTKAEGSSGPNKMELTTTVSRMGNKILEFKEADLRFGDKVILDGFTYEFKRGDRIGIVGGNGVGKTTFLKVLMQMQALDAGEVIVGETVVFGYYDQAGVDLPEDVRVFDYVQDILSFSGQADPKPLKELEKYGFETAQAYTEIGRLSGGEKRRLQLLEVMASEPNFLVLDEVTNDLDLQTLTLLENFLLDYKGVLVVVSHDRFFMDRITNHLFVFEGQGQIMDFTSNFSEFLDYRRQLAVEQAAANAAVQETPAAAAPKSAPKKKMSNKERKEYETLLDDIDRLEKRQTELESRIAQGHRDYDELATVTQQIEDKSARWIELEEAYSAVQ